MTETQIRVPEKLFQEIHIFAQRREWSLAETFRRGAELLLPFQIAKHEHSLELNPVGIDAMLSDFESLRPLSNRRQIQFSFRCERKEADVFDFG